MLSIITIPSCFASDSTHIGRFDPSLLSQQARMELLVENLRHQAFFRDADGGFTSAKDWPGVRVDPHGNIISIKKPWGSAAFEGEIAFQWLPETIETLHCDHACIQTDFHAASFPRDMMRIELQGNKLTGSIATAELPPKLVRLNLWHNRISGTIDLTTLPGTLVTLMLDENEIMGTIDLQNLPKTLHTLDLAKNLLSGDVIVRILPESLTKINLSGNTFDGELLVEEAAFETRRTLRVGGNNFREKVVAKVPKYVFFDV